MVKKSSLVVSVNTSTVHIAAATSTPVIVLYALTNPQHAPWKAKGELLLFDVAENLQSKNEVIQFVQRNLHPQNVGMVTPQQIIQAVQKVLFGNDNLLIPELIPLRHIQDQVFQ